MTPKSRRWTFGVVVGGAVILIVYAYMRVDATYPMPSAARKTIRANEKHSTVRSEWRQDLLYNVVSEEGGKALTIIITNPNALIQPSRLRLVFSQPITDQVEINFRPPLLPQRIILHRLVPERPNLLDIRFDTPPFTSDIQLVVKVRSRSDKLVNILGIMRRWTGVTP